jgi:hypothetical protein
MSQGQTVTEPAPGPRQGKRYHTDACGKATTKRCRCFCGGARHGELRQKDFEEMYGKEAKEVEP